jgi:transcriptional regulator with XRE-family HTH domain
MRINEDQRRQFGEALRSERRGCGISQRVVGYHAGRYSGSLVGQWEAGASTPSADAVFALEEFFDLPPGGLSRHLGFAPLGELGHDVSAAIEADPRLTDAWRKMLTATYRAAISESGGETASKPTAASKRSRRVE